MAEGITATGAGCDIATMEIGPQNETLGNPTKEQVSCSVGGDEVTVNLFDDHAKLQSSMSFIRAGECFVRGNMTFVVGDNWIVYPERAATAKRLADLLDLPTHTIHC